ncbi:MAG: hypothetical protein KAV43_01950 [Hadesarchaea archaeon]|nr:hypothetical protein [Hadesarchaea archaeon]
MAIFKILRRYTNPVGLGESFPNQGFLWVNPDSLAENLHLFEGRELRLGPDAEILCGVDRTEKLNAFHLDIVVGVYGVPHHVVDVIGLNA